MPASSPTATAPAEARAKRSPWFWVPSLYFSQGIPYVIVMTMSVVMYKRLGISNTNIALYTSWLNLPWVIKPLWSPVVDIFKTKRLWVVSMQFTVSAALLLVAFALRQHAFFFCSLSLFWVMAFASATHDIAADGFYMLALTKHEQAWFVGLRSTFYRTAMIVGSGLLVVIAGKLEDQLQNIPLAWSLTVLTIAALFLLFSSWHFVVLPRPSADGPVASRAGFISDFAATFSSFFTKPGAPMALAFILLYRFDEAQLSKVVLPFLLDPRSAGGLGLATKQVGLAYGTYGVLALLFGGIVGGLVAAKYGLKKVLPVMVCSMYIPKFAFLYLSYAQPLHFAAVCLAVATEQFGYGFGFTAFMLYLLYFADGPHKTAHYALCTGFMALGMMVPGMWSGWIESKLGYPHFFIWVSCCSIPGFILAMRLKIDPQFGKKAKEVSSHQRLES